MSEIVDKIIDILSSKNDLKIRKNGKFLNVTKKRLEDILDNTVFCDKLENIERKYNISPYTAFIEYKLSKGVHLNDVLKLWDKVKNDEKKMDKYIKKAEKLKRKLSI